LAISTIKVIEKSKVLNIPNIQLGRSGKFWGLNFIVYSLDIEADPAKPIINNKCHRKVL
jgi:hypothetical protein